MEALGASEKIKRGRKSVKRGRTGCVTCKIRRVKCDGMVTPALRLKELILTEPTSQNHVLAFFIEGKPILQRCQKFGTKCDENVQPREVPSAALLPKLTMNILQPTFGFANEVGKDTLRS
jgi:hypothetical protein